nr:LysM peptidoglycan-binding domain-containing protein [Rubellimicrobium aerolatum]
MDSRNLRALALALAGAGLLSGVVVLGLPRLLPAERSAALLAPDASAPAATAPALLEAPAFDAVRVAPDGGGLVAGRAAPGARVSVLSGEDVVAQATADEDGRFVAFLDLPPSDRPRELALRDGGGREGEGSVLLAPAAPPAEVAPTAVGPEAPRPDLGRDPKRGPEPGAAAIASGDPSGPDGVGVPASGAGPPGDPGQSPVLLSDAGGVRVLEPALPPGAEPLSSIALDAIAYGAGGEVTLSGRASGEGVVRLYLDNRPAGEVPITPDGGWRADFGGTAPGVYTLRVDEIGPDGAVASRIETPFQREEREQVAAALAPGGGSTVAVRTVQPGNTLWAIARERYGEPLMYVRVFERNRDRIRDPDLIYPGQVFVLPEEAGP